MRFLILVIAVAVVLTFVLKARPPFGKSGSHRTADRLEAVLTAAADHGEGTRPSSVTCTRSHALDSVKQFTAYYTCDVVGSDGLTHTMCAFARGSNALEGSLPASCE